MGELLKVLESDRATRIHRIAVALRFVRLAMEPPAGDVAAAVLDLLEGAEVGAVVLHRGDPLFEPAEFGATDLQNSAAGFAAVFRRGLTTGRALLESGSGLVVDSAAVRAVVGRCAERLLSPPAICGLGAVRLAIKWFPAR